MTTNPVKIGHYILGRTIGTGGFARVKSNITLYISGSSWFNQHRSSRKNNKQKEHEK